MNMKPRHTLAVLMLLVCLCIFGQQPKTVPFKDSLKKHLPKFPPISMNSFCSCKQKTKRCKSNWRKWRKILSYIVVMYELRKRTSMKCCLIG